MKPSTYITIVSIFCCFLSNLPITSIGQNPKTTAPDIRVIDEINKIDITGVKADFMIVTISKHKKCKILSEKGMDEISKIALPESFDPTYIAHFPEARNYSHVFSDLECTKFEVSLVDKNGKTKKAPISKENKTTRMVLFEKDQFGGLKQPEYSIGNLALGDEVTIDYSYDIRYDANMYLLSSFRVFFHGKHFKENYQFLFSYSSELDIDINCQNHEAADSCYMTEDRATKLWKRSDLLGCINEQGARPYITLPHIVISLKPKNLEYVLPNSFEKRYMPFYALYAMQREKQHLNIAKSVIQGVKTHDYNLIDRFIREKTEDMENDTLGYQSLLKVHNHIADECTFENDIDYFKRIDKRMPRMGEFLAANKIRDISRFDIYVALISKLNLYHFTAYLSDKRSGIISDSFFTPMYDSDYLFAVVLSNNTVQFIYPKKSRFGYYLNEVPFYYENTTARLVHLDDYCNIEKPINEEFREITVPTSNFKDNWRRTNSMVKIDLNNLSTNFQSRIELSGQYSTLTRGLYQYNDFDKTINPRYSKKLTDINAEATETMQKVKLKSKEFPFPATIDLQFDATGTVRLHNEKYQLDLSNWFNHIIYQNLDTTKRVMDFYPDFMGKDTYVYMLQFSKPVKLVEPLQQVKIKNNFGELMIDIVQPDPTHFKVSSYFAITHPKVEVKNIGDVRKIYDEIEKLNSLTLELK